MGLMRFNIRVYGIWIEKNKILISRESLGDLHFTKFPGGGLEPGEGVLNCLKRECREELGITINHHELFYVTEDAVVSAFNAEEQLISIYYFISSDSKPDLAEREEIRWEKPYYVQAEWISLDQLHEDIFYFPVDKMVVKLLMEKYPLR